MPTGDLAIEDLPDEPMPDAFDTGKLLRRGLWAVAALALVGLAAWLAPGLGEVRSLLGRASAGWLVVAVALEVGSGLSYVAMFRPAFCHRMRWRSSAEIGLSELGVASIVPAAGAGGVALGAWILGRAGMPPAIVAQRSVAFLLIKSAVNFVAVAVIGLLMFFGVGPHQSPALTILPAVLAAGVLAGVPLLARWSARASAERSSMRLRNAGMAIGDGAAEAGRLLRTGDPLLLGGSVGYWLFDNLVLLTAFHAFGAAPPVIVILMAYLIGQLGGALPIPGGIGAVDGGLIGALIVYGIPVAGAAAAVLLYRVILFWVPIVMGLPAFLSLRRGVDDIRRPDLCLPPESAASTP